MGGSPRPTGVLTPPLASTVHPEADLVPSPSPIPGKEAAGDVVKLHPGCSLSAGKDDWALATLSLPGSSRMALLKKTVPRGNLKLQRKDVEARSFPDEILRLRDGFAVDISSLPAADALCLLRFGLPEAYNAAMAEAMRVAGIEAQGERAAVPCVDLMKQGMQEAVKSAGIHFLSYWTMSYTCNDARGEDAEYTAATAKLMGLFGKSWGPAGPSPCLFAGNTVFVRALDNSPLWLGITSQKQSGSSAGASTLTAVSEPMRVQVHASHDRRYCGPLFLGQRVLLTGASGSIEVELSSARHAWGPAMLEYSFCFEEALCDGQVRAHDVLLQLDPAMPQGSWEKWFISLMGQAGSPWNKGFRGKILSEAQYQVGQPWTRELLESYVEAHAKQYETKLWRLTLQHLQKIACARLPALLALSEDDNNIPKPTVVLRKCCVSNNNAPGRRSQRVMVQGSEENTSSMRCQWDMLVLSPLTESVDGTARNPLAPVTPCLLKEEGVLEQPHEDMELLHWFLIRYEPLMFFRSKASSSLRAILGQKTLDVKMLQSTVKLLAYDEASRSLAVLDGNEDTIQIYYFDALQTLTDTGVAIHLQDVGGMEVNWMGLTPNGERLLVADKHSVRAFAIGQQGMVYSRHIKLQSPFSGKACVSPGGTCLLVLSSAPGASAGLQQGSVQAGAPAPAPACTSAAEAESSEVVVNPTDMAPPASENSATSEPDEDGGRAETCGATVTEPSAQGGAPVGEAGAVVSDEGAKCSVDVSLQVDVYGLESMEHLVSVPLAELRGTPEEWEVRCATFGTQSHLVLLHRPTARLESRILHVSVRDRGCKVEVQ